MRSVAFCLFGCVFAVLGLARVATSATLPDHEPLSVLVIADAVNPHRLSPAELTEPEDIAPALTAVDSGLSVRDVSTVDSQCVDVGLGHLEGATPPDVLLYFAHRAARQCDGGDGQSRLVAAAEQGLLRGMGIVVLHHGLYGDLYTPGAKDSMLQLVGAEASGLTWDSSTGQRVFLVGRDHFVSSNGLVTRGTADLDAFDGFEAGPYSYFDNVPDERYPETNLLVQTGEIREPLFATNSGGNRLLGYTLQRPGWLGRVVAYQPGEYQPNALDDRAGNNFQILVNALYFAARGNPVASENTTEASDVTSAAVEQNSNATSLAPDVAESTASAAASTELDAAAPFAPESNGSSASSRDTRATSHQNPSNAAPVATPSAPAASPSAPSATTPRVDSLSGATATHTLGDSGSSGCVAAPSAGIPDNVWWLGGWCVWVVRRRHQRRPIVSRRLDGERAGSKPGPGPDHVTS